MKLKRIAALTLVIALAITAVPTTTYAKVNLVKKTSSETATYKKKKMVEMSYTVLKAKGHSKAAKTINKVVDSYIADFKTTYNSEKSDLKGMYSFIKSLGYDTCSSMTLSMKKKFQNKKYISLIAYDTYYSAGGAHPTTAIKTLNVKTKTGKICTMSDVLHQPKAKVKKRILKALARFDKKHPNVISTSFSSYKPTVKSMNLDYIKYVIGKKYITVIFGEYEIASYAAGIIKVKIKR